MNTIDRKTGDILGAPSLTQAALFLANEGVRGAVLLLSKHPLTFSFVFCRISVIASFKNVEALQFEFERSGLPIVAHEDAHSLLSTLRAIAEKGRRIPELSKLYVRSNACAVTFKEHP